MRGRLYFSEYMYLPLMVSVFWAPTMCQDENASLHFPYPDFFMKYSISVFGIIIYFTLLRIFSVSTQSSFWIPNLISEGIIKGMARIFRMFLSSVGVLLGACPCWAACWRPLNSSYIYKLFYNALAQELPRQFVESPSLEVFKNRTKYPSVHNGFDAFLLIRRNRLDFSVKVCFSLECS